MATTDTFYFRTDSTAGGDGTEDRTDGSTRAYPSAEAANVAKAADITAATGSDKIIHFITTQGGVDTTLLDVQGWTTAAGNYVIFECQGNAVFTGNSRERSGTGYQIKVAAGGACRCREDYVRFIGFEFATDNINSGGVIEQTVVGSSSDVRWDDCGIVVTISAPSTTNNMVQLSLTNLTATITNCLILAETGRGPDTRNATSVTFDHCGLYGSSTQILGFTGDSELTITDSYSMGFTSEDFWTGGAAPTGSYNASEDTSATTDYSNSQVSRVPATEFVTPDADPATGDFTLKSGNTIGVLDSVGGAIGPTFTTPTVPTLSAPDTATEATTSGITGTNLDTLETTGEVSLITTTGSFTKVQTYGTPTATTVPDVDWETGQDEARDAAGYTAVLGVPLTATISAAGVTAWQQQVKVDNGVDAAATRNITVSAESGLDVIQTMTGTASNTTDGESIFATTILTLEDNHQAAVPDSVNGMNITWSADGTFTTDADQTEDIDVIYFTPSTKQWKKVTLTISGSSVVSGGVGSQGTYAPYTRIHSRR